MPCVPFKHGLGGGGHLTVVRHPNIKSFKQSGACCLFAGCRWRWQASNFPWLQLDVSLRAYGGSRLQYRQCTCHDQKGRRRLDINVQIQNFRLGPKTAHEFPRKAFLIPRSLVGEGAFTVS